MSLMRHCHINSTIGLSTGIRLVKEKAEELCLGTKRLERPDGRVTGAGLFDRGHIHYILTNPIDTGRIRHKRQTYDGQHAEIIDPEVWNQVQRMLEARAARARRQLGLFVIRRSLRI